MHLVVPSELYAYAPASTLRAGSGVAQPADASHHVLRHVTGIEREFFRYVHNASRYSLLYKKCSFWIFIAAYACAYFSLFSVTILVSSARTKTVPVQPTSIRQVHPTRTDTFITLLPGEVLVKLEMEERVTESVENDGELGGTVRYLPTPCYAMSGTNLAYGAQVLRDVQYSSGV
eukprot:2355507-Rhodomonas_salina.2